MPQAKKKPQVPDTIIKVGRQGAVYQQKTYQTWLTDTSMQNP